MNIINSRIKNFPITFFSVVMGLAGLAIALSKAYHLQWLSKSPYVVSLLLMSAVFVYVFVVYAIKSIYYFEEVKKEFNHKVKINFFSAIPISFLLVSIAFYSMYPMLAIPLWCIGVIWQVIMTIITLEFWIKNNFEIHNINPAWFIPIVGNTLVPILGADLVSPFVNGMFLSVGLFFWIVLFAIIFYRLIFHPQLAERFIPTMFIFIAPPAVAFIAYMRTYNSFDFISLMLLMLMYFFVALVFFIGKSYLKIKFYISWWAYTFPLSAAAIASMVAYQTLDIVFFKNVSIFILAVDLLVVFIVSVITIISIFNKKICIEED